MRELTPTWSESHGIGVGGSCMGCGCGMGRYGAFPEGWFFGDGLSADLGAWLYLHSRVIRRESNFMMQFEGIWRKEKDKQKREKDRLVLFLN